MFIKKNGSIHNGKQKYGCLSCHRQFVEAPENKIIPEETRRALPDGNSAYMRPLPGAARMYPETDVPPVVITEERVNSIKIPELLSDIIEKRKAKYVRDFKLNEELANQIARSINSPFIKQMMKQLESTQKLIKHSPILHNYELFEKIMQQVQNANSTMVVRTLEGSLPELDKEGVPVKNTITEEHLTELFKLHAEGKIPNEAIIDILKIIAKKPEITVEGAARSLGIGGVKKGELETAIDKLIESKMDFIREKGLNSVGPLMGVIMKEFRGKVSGQEVSMMLTEKISKKFGYD